MPPRVPGRGTFSVCRPAGYWLAHARAARRGLSAAGARSDAGLARGRLCRRCHRRWAAGAGAGQTNAYDALVLDVMVPEVDGLAILRRVRATGSNAAVVIITARDQLPDRIARLDLGAADYLVKPFALDELLARLRAVIRRRYQAPTDVVALGDLVIASAARAVRRGGKPVTLSSREFALLEYLALRRGQFVTRTEIWEHVYDFAAEPSSNVVDVY